MLTTLLFWFLQIATPAQKTTPPNPADLCTIQGVVIQAGTGEPLHKAIVEATPEEKKANQEEPEGGSAETDAMGRFEIKGLAPGRYRLSASHNGFVRQPYGQRTPDGPGAMLTLSPGQKLPDITFQLTPAAVIAGHVYDEDGEPMVYAQVAAMHYRYVNGQRELVASGMAQTNDLGEYRLFGLLPGQYLVQATVRARRFENSKIRRGYAPVYYPGVPDSSRAAPITVRGGDESTGVDISLQLIHSFTVKGNVLSAGCGATAGGAMVFLREQNSTNNFGWMNPARSADAHGAFEIANVNPGTYYLFAVVNDEGKQCMARQALEVADADIDGITITVVPDVEIKGRIRVDGQLDACLSCLKVNLAPKSGAMFFGMEDGQPDSDGSFLLKNATDGDYELSVGSLPENYFIKSARLDGVDVLTTGVTIDAKQAPTSLDILVSPNGASVDGVITKDHQPFPAATVVLAPDPPLRAVRRLFKSTTTDQNGHFLLQGLPPGDYKVFVWEKIEPGAYTSPEFLQPYENLGESVHLTEGSHNAVQVDLIPARETSP